MHEFREGRSILVEFCQIALETLAGVRSRLNLPADLAGQRFDAFNQLLGARGLKTAFIQFADLHVHRPDHLVEAVRFDDRSLDGMLLILERLDLLIDVFGERVQAGHPLFGVPAQLLEFGQRAQALFDILDECCRCLRLLTGVMREIPGMGDVPEQICRVAAERIELTFHRTGLVSRSANFSLRAPQLVSKRIQPGSILLQRFEAFPRRFALRGQRLEHGFVLLQRTIGGRQPCRRVLGVLDGLAQRLNPRINLFELRRSHVGFRQAFHDFVQPRVRFSRLLVDLLESLARGCQFRCLKLHLREHRAQRGALFATRGNQRFQLLSLGTGRFP